jgi:hypothetical protein
MVPEAPLRPDQPPEAWHSREFCADQVSVEDPLAGTLVGFAVSDTIGVDDAANETPVLSLPLLHPAISEAARR